MLSPRQRKWGGKKESIGDEAHLREQHTDLLHFFNGEQRVACRMFKQDVQEHLRRTIELSLDKPNRPI